jgi:general secretion pathway protein N
MAAASAANPLWAVPLTSLTITGTRPLFSPSRRPPAPAVVAAPAPPAAKPPPPPPAAPDRPSLTLVGTIVGKTGSLGIFVDQMTNKIVRLYTAETHAGWTLKAIRGRQAILANEQRVVTLILPDPLAAGQSAVLPIALAGQPGANWVDGDGQRIAAPQSARLPQPATWVDGDGQTISPPNKN